MAERWLIAGLGNPGSKYDRTRHNAGFWFLDAMAKALPVSLKANKKLFGAVDKVKFDGQELIFLRPDTFMNDSGQAIRAVMDFYDIELDHLLVAYDDLDLPPGAIRLKFGGGHGGHNGLRSTFSHVGSPNFWRLRIGIGHPGTREQVTPWVLGRASAPEEAAIEEAIRKALPIVPLWWHGQAESAVQKLHTKDS